MKKSHACFSPQNLFASWVLFEIAQSEKWRTLIHQKCVIADTFGIELLELFNFGEKNVFYLAADNNQNSFNCKNLQSTDFSDEKNEFEHELEKARLLLQQQEKEIAYLKEIISLMKKE